MNYFLSCLERRRYLSVFFLRVDSMERCVWSNLKPINKNKVFHSHSAWDSFSGQVTRSLEVRPPEIFHNSSSHGIWGPDAPLQEALAVWGQRYLLCALCWSSRLQINKFLRDHARLIWTFFHIGSFFSTYNRCKCLIGLCKGKRISEPWKNLVQG